MARRISRNPSEIQRQEEEPVANNVENLTEEAPVFESSTPVGVSQEDKERAERERKHFEQFKQVQASDNQH